MKMDKNEQNYSSFSAPKTNKKPAKITRLGKFSRTEPVTAKMRG
jgi:hypothetical protein